MIKYVLYFLFIMLLLLIIFSLVLTKKVEKNNQKKSKKIGEGEYMMNLTRHKINRAMPNIVLLKDQIHTWVVNVPLTPFKAPLRILPELGSNDTLPEFFLFNMDFLTPIQNQGDCGSCYIFGVCNMLSDRVMLNSRGKYLKTLSVQQLLNCWDREGCDGGSPEELTLWIEKTNRRIIPQSVLPYKSSKGGFSNGKCIDEYRDYSVGVEKNSVYTTTEFIEENNYDEEILQSNIHNMKLDLYENGPFYCAMTIYDDFFNYNGLKPYIPKKNSSIIGGHCINIIGWCDKGVDKRDGYSEGYWICRNSWGKNWPIATKLDGYFTIPMGKNMCGIESRCGGAIPELYTNEKGESSKSLDSLIYTDFDSYYTE